MRIFVGSSGKKKRTAGKIAEALQEAGFTPWPWWDERVFKGGNVTIQRLIEVSDICDGAVFVFGADDRMVLEQEGKTLEIPITRDNVILEYGIFAGKTGIDRTLFLRDPRVKVPSDLKGVTYVQRRGFERRIVDALKDAMKRYPGKKHIRKVTIHADKKLSGLLLAGGDESWASRSLYIGRGGANSWSAVEEDPGYTGHIEFAGVQSAIKTMCEKHELNAFDYIVSFGPGVGSLDKHVVPYLRGQQLVSYIPVDINHYLAGIAADNVDGVSEQIHSPFCIIGDFESFMDVISQTIRAHSSPGRAFIMLGGTFGNLEKGENTFLQGLHDCMDAEDIAVLDIFTACKGYSHEKDHLHPLSKQPDSVQRYLAFGVAKKSGRSIEEIVSDIDAHVCAEQKPSSDSDVDNTHTFSFRCRTTKRDVIFVRRYDHTSFGNHLMACGFDVIDSEVVGERLVTRSVFFVRKKS